MVCNICACEKWTDIIDSCPDMRLLGGNFSKGESKIVVCNNCGFVYVSYENAKQKDFSNFYNSSSYHPVNHKEVQEEKTEDYWQHGLNAVRQYIVQDSSILDIAGGYGELTCYFKKNGYDNITLMEICDECIKHAEEKGIKTWNMDICDEELVVQEQYDCILATHDLEHFIDVSTAMKNIYSLLKENGILLLEVPDLEGYEYQEKPPYYYLTYQHAVHFTEKSLLNLVRLSGFSIINIEHYVKCEDYPCVTFICKKQKGDFACTIKDESGLAAMRRYIEKSNASLTPIADRIRAVRTPMILWGVGASTAQMVMSLFEGCNVTQIVDSNEAKRGLEFLINGERIACQTPDEIQNSEDVIFILSVAWGKDIERSIREMGLKNPIFHMEEFL